VGAVGYRSKRETQPRAANAEARLASDQAKLAKAQHKALEQRAEQPTTDENRQALADNRERWRRLFSRKPSDQEV
jgi:hypothetical protein